MMLKKFRNAKSIISSENGGPSLETIIIICVVLIIAVALFAFGHQVSNKISEAKDTVSGLEVADPE